MSSAEAVINKCIVPVSPHEGICVLHACYRCERDALPTELRPRTIAGKIIAKPARCKTKRAKNKIQSERIPCLVLIELGQRLQPNIICRFKFRFHSGAGMSWVVATLSQEPDESLVPA